MNSDDAANQQEDDETEFTEDDLAESESSDHVPVFLPNVAEHLRAAINFDISELLDLPIMDEITASFTANVDFSSLLGGVDLAALIEPLSVQLTGVDFSAGVPQVGILTIAETVDLSGFFEQIDIPKIYDQLEVSSIIKTALTGIDVSNFTTSASAVRAAEQFGRDLTVSIELDESSWWQDLTPEQRALFSTTFGVVFVMIGPTLFSVLAAPLALKLVVTVTLHLVNREIQGRIKGNQPD